MIEFLYSIQPYYTFFFMGVIIAVIVTLIIELIKLFKDGDDYESH